MTRIYDLNRRYSASYALVRDGVEILAVGDPISARFNAATRQLLIAAKNDGPGLWDDLVGATKALRWRLVTQPQPISMNPALKAGAEEVVRQSRLLRGAVSNGAILEALATSASLVGITDPPMGRALLRSVQEVGPGSCVVVAASSAAASAIGDWPTLSGTPVLTAGELERTRPDVSQAYVVGPPRFFRSSLVTAPVTTSVTFLMPSWFGDRQIPHSTLAAYADGALRLKSRVFLEGDTSDSESLAEDSVVAEDQMLPQPVWGTHRSDDREPASDEVSASKVVLSGGIALWLDDGDRIRVLDPAQPSGERVGYSEPGDIRPGAYLLIRRGETERTALHQAALAALGARRESVDASQQRWKAELEKRVRQYGHSAVVTALRIAGVKASDRARAWAEPLLARPSADRDFEALLGWLGLPTQPYFANATLLRASIISVGQKVRHQLEDAVSAADLAALEREGSLTLDAKTYGFRSMVAARVLAISPFSEIVNRRDARVPFEDGGGRWLE